MGRKNVEATLKVITKAQKSWENGIITWHEFMSRVNVETQAQLLSYKIGEAEQEEKELYTVEVEAEFSWDKVFVPALK